MNKEAIIKKLREDEHYYGEFGKQYLSNSDIRTLLNNPLALGEQSKPSPAFLVGGYFKYSTILTLILCSFIIDNVSDFFIQYLALLSGLITEVIELL